MQHALMKKPEGVFGLSTGVLRPNKRQKRCRMIGIQPIERLRVVEP